LHEVCQAIEKKYSHLIMSWLRLEWDVGCLPERPLSALGWQNGEQRLPLEACPSSIEELLRAVSFVRNWQIPLAPRPGLAKLSGSMAKTCWLERNKRKQKTVAKYAALRAEMKAKGDYVGLSMLPRDASPTRLVNRCKVSGRRRAYIRRFGMSRMTFREHAMMGLIPGVTKASW
jgi:small subunit ribosomal protein S14